MIAARQPAPLRLQVKDVNGRRRARAASPPAHACPAAAATSCTGAAAAAGGGSAPSSDALLLGLAAAAAAVALLAAAVADAAAAQRVRVPRARTPGPRAARADALVDSFPNASISANLLPAALPVRPTAGVVEGPGGGGWYIAGLDAASAATVALLADDGAQLWRATVGRADASNEGASPPAPPPARAASRRRTRNLTIACAPPSPLLPPVYALATDASGNVYVGGRLARPVDAATGGGAFVASFDPAGAARWVTTFGSVASRDAVRGLVAGESGSLYAGGGVGTLSALFEGAAGGSNSMRPLMVKLAAADGATLFSLRPDPVKAGVDEEITSLAVDSSRSTLVYAGGTQAGSAGVVYKFEDKDIVASYRLKASGPVAAVVASTERPLRFAAVGGCFLNRIVSDGTTFTESTTRMEDRGSCLGDARGAAFRGRDETIVVLVEGPGRSRPELLLYSDASGGLVGRAAAPAGSASATRGPALSGDARALIVGAVGSGTSARTFVGGAELSQQAELVKKSLANAASGAPTGAPDKSVWVKVAAIGGSAAVFVGGVLITMVIVAYNKRTGEPA